MFKKLVKLIKNNWVQMILLFLSIISLLAIFLIIYFLDHLKLAWATNSSKALMISVYVFLCLVVIYFLLLIFFNKKEQRNKNNLVNKGINHYVESLVSKFSIGLVIFQPNGKILWVSDFIEERFGEKIILEDITYFGYEFNSQKLFKNFQKILKKGEFVYNISFIANEMIMIVKDITQEYSATHFYELEKLVIGEIEIDNYQMFRASFSDEQIFLFQSKVKELLDNLVKKYNFVYRQYMDGKFIVLTNRENLNKLVINKFAEFEKISKVKIDRIKPSLSVGFGADTSNYFELMEMAKEGLYQSQTRGGDQITIISSIEKIKRFGSKSEISVVKSRTKIKNAANNLKIRLQDPKIKNVVIYGHKFADLDAIGAAYALYEVAKEGFKKNAYIQNVTFDHTAQKAIEKYISNPSDIFVPKVKAKMLSKDDTVVVIVDCAEDTRVENATIFSDVKTENVFIFDHHRVSKLDSIVDVLNTYIESTASSASEIITELIQFNEFKNYLSPLGAQMLFNGIYLDTNQFKKSASSRTFAAAAALEDWGANIEDALSLMKISQETNEKIIQIVSKSKEVKPGYWLSYTNQIIPIDVVSMAADEILRIEGRKAAFVVAQLPKTSNSDNAVYKLSARSIGVNVQLIAEAVGGGGHFNAAAAVSDSKTNESLESFVDNIIQAIISLKE